MYWVDLEKLDIGYITSVKIGIKTHIRKNKIAFKKTIHLRTETDRVLWSTKAMEFTVNWIIFSAVAIAVGTSIETRKWSPIFILFLYAVYYFRYFRRDMTFSWHWRFAIFFGLMSPFKGCSLILIEFTSMQIESDHLISLLFWIVSSFDNQIGPKVGNSFKIVKKKSNTDTACGCVYAECETKIKKIIYISHNAT